MGFWGRFEVPTKIFLSTNSAEITIFAINNLMFGLDKIWAQIWIRRVEMNNISNF